MSTGPCYIGSNSVISEVHNFWPCYDGNATNPYVSCCAVGHICLSNGLCQYSDPPTGGSGVYTGGCTDVSLTDGSCQSYCKALAGSEVIYSDNLWHCCGVNGDNPRCNDPQGPDFQDPSPYELKKIALIEGTSSKATAHSEYPTGIAAFTSGQTYPVFGTATPTGTAGATQTKVTSISTTTSGITSLASTSSPIPSVTAADSSDASANSGMSTGAIVGMVVGIVSILALTAAVLAFTCIYRRSQRKADPDERDPSILRSEDTLLKDHWSSSGQKSYYRNDPKASGLVPSPISPLTPYELSRHGSKAIRGREGDAEYDHSRDAHELQSPLGTELYELPAVTRPAEMMAVARTEDRMAGGGPDKRLPSTPSTPSSVAHGWLTRAKSDTSRYRSLLAR